MGLFGRATDPTPAVYEYQARQVMAKLANLNMADPGHRREAARKRRELLDELDEALDAYNFLVGLSPMTLHER